MKKNLVAILVPLTIAIACSLGAWANQQSSAQDGTYKSATLRRMPCEDCAKAGEAGVGEKLAQAPQSDKPCCKKEAASQSVKKPCCDMTAGTSAANAQGSPQGGQKPCCAKEGPAEQKPCCAKEGPAEQKPCCAKEKAAEKKPCCALEKAAQGDKKPCCKKSGADQKI